jgi:adenine-specific DNA-methyltransferase
VDIDPGAVEIAKLRLWLSLVVDEEDVKQIKPLPNLDYKTVTGNSLLGVEKTLFNEGLFKQLEELKPHFFDESNASKKLSLRGQIDTLIHEITNNKEMFDFQIYFSEVFHHKRGFDVVIANPPYVGQKGHKDIFQEIAKTDFGKKFHQRRMDLFYFFFHLALDLLVDKGTAAFITTNYYITATYADKLRKDLRKRSDLLILMNFNELKLFESALGQHNMISIFQKGHANSKALTATSQRRGFAKPQEIEAFLACRDSTTTYRKVAQADLYSLEDMYISLPGHAERADNQVQRVLAKMSVGTYALGTITTITQGIITGADRLKQKYVDRYSDAGFTLNEGVFVLAAEECHKKGIPMRSRHVKPYFKNSDIKKYYTANDAPRRLLYFKDEKQKQPIEDVILKHFKRFEQVLVDRLSVCKKNQFQWNIVSKWIARGEFYLLFYPRKPRVFDGEKIVAPQRSYDNTFGYNNTPWYASSDVYFINPNDDSVSLKFILALLNSKLFFAWLYHKGKKKGEMLELYKKPLSEIPIKRISPDEQKPFIKLADRILAAKQNDAEADTNALEREMDELVYSLYGLTPEEIAVVEESTPPFA